eukprot:3879306-Ditylum_brightwellii.AAC.1
MSYCICCVQKLVDLACDALDGDAPETVNHHQAHMYTDTTKLVLREQNMKMIFFYHNAISLNTFSKYTRLDEDKTPFESFGSAIIRAKQGDVYKNSPTGNAHKLNPLNSNCNHNIHCTILEYISLTPVLTDINEQTFLVSIQKWKFSAYLRL